MPIFNSSLTVCIDWGLASAIKQVQLGPEYIRADTLLRCLHPKAERRDCMWLRSFMSNEAFNNVKDKKDSQFPWKNTE